MTVTRHAAVAGMFYPADAKTLKGMIHSFLEKVHAPASNPKAIIVPHAGYVYSGAIAASAYARLKLLASNITRVILVGPSHHVAFRGLAVSHAEAYETPLGDIAIDQEGVAQIIALPFVNYVDQAHAMEHSLEVQLPFLQEILNRFSLLPLVAGDAKPEEVSQVLELLWGGEETLIVVSSDLSHYHDYETAQKMDSLTSAAIEALRYQDIGHEFACGRVPVSGLLYAAQRRHLGARTVDLRNSGDTAGQRDRVVGYGAYVFE